MSPTSSILIYGRDASLLETRRLVLQQAGFLVWTVTTLTDAEKLLTTQPGGLFILCHSLSPVDCAHASAMVHSRQPGMKNLVLTGTEPVRGLGGNDEQMSSLDGLQALLATVNRLLRSSTSARQLQALLHADQHDLNK